MPSAPPAPPMPPNPNDYPPGYAAANRGDAAVAVYWAECAVAILVITARLTARGINKAIGLDDWMMLFTVLLFIGMSGVVTSLANLGGFHHLLFVPMQNGSQVALQNMILQTLTITSFGVSKFSVGYFIIRILPPASVWRRYFLWVLIVLTLVYNCSEVVAQWTQCDPPSHLWNPFSPGTCWDSNTVLINFYVGSVYNIVVDVILAVLPWTVIWKLNTSKQRRISLSVLLSMGLLAAVCSCIKVSYGHSIVSQDKTWNTYDLNVWSGSEVFVIIVCGSLPPLATLWDRLVLKKLPSRFSKGSTDYSEDSSKSDESKKYRHNATASSSSATTSRNSEADSVDLEKDPLPDNEIHTRTDIEIVQEQRRLSPNGPIPGLE